MRVPELPSDLPVSEESRLLEGIASMMQTLSTTPSIHAAMESALKILGEAAVVDRVYIFKNGFHPNTGGMFYSQYLEWVAEGVSREIDNPNLQQVDYHPDFAILYQNLASGSPFLVIVEQAPSPLRELLQSQSILSLAILPIVVSNQFWGFIGFDDCKQPREWTSHTLRMLESASSAIGSALTRHEVDSALVAANQELKRQTEELRRVQRVTISLMEDAKNAQVKAAHASAAKSEFLAIMSHEMRTPLNGILGFAELLLEESDPNVLRETAWIIRDSGKVLLDMISDVLDFSKIESGRLELDPSPVVIRTMLSEIITSISGSALEKHLVVESTVDHAVPVAVFVDDKRLRQILLNVLGNAVKFTNEGHIELRLNASAAIDGSVVLFFEIEDTGIGIDPRALEHIFEPFDQADRSVHRQFGGTGLGLSISRKLCRLMQGDLTVQSTLGKGSTFAFSVGCELAKFPPPATKIGKASTVPRLAEDFPMSILVVDDVATNRLLACRLLAKMGYDAHTAENGEQAVNMASEKKYHLILMDVFMPGIDGCEATQQIRSRENQTGHRATIFGLSADVMDDNRQRCIESGMDGFLSKPIRIPDFVQTVKNLADNDPGLTVR